MYSSAEEVRKILGLEEDDAPDERVNYFLEKAQKEVQNDLCVYVKEESMGGNIDGSNTTFTWTYVPMSDSNFDKTVNASDCTVYTWGSRSSIESRSSASISTIYPNDGTLILSAAPASTIALVTIEYYYWPQYLEPSDLDDLVGVLAAYKFVMSEYLLIPENWMHGSYRFKRGNPWDNLMAEYNRKKLLIVKREHVKGEHGSVTFLRDE